MCLGLQVGWGAGHQPKRQPAQRKDVLDFPKTAWFLLAANKMMWAKIRFSNPDRRFDVKSIQSLFFTKKNQRLGVEQVFSRREPSAEPTLWRPLSWMTARFEREKSMSYFLPTCQNKSALVCSVWVLLCEAWRRDRGHSGRTGLCKATPTLLSWLRHQRGV